MDFEFSEDQKLIQQQVRSVLEKMSTPEKVRVILDSDQPYDTQLWHQAVELGWVATRIPEQYGGLGWGYLELAVIAEELGRSLAPIPFSSSVYLATEAILLAGTQQQKEHYLPKLASGEYIGCIATAEQQGLLQSSALECRVLDGLIHGDKLPVADGDIANFSVVLANDDSGCSLYLVDLDSTGVQRSTLKTVDPSRSHAKIQFDGAEAQLLGGAGQGEELLSQLLDISAVLFSFEQVGGSQAALDMGLEYSKNRYAFGRQIASFQAIKHKFADMFTSLELARSNAYYGAWALSCLDSDDSSPELALAASTARLSAIDAYYLCSKENTQAHGGMGFTWEFNCHLYYRRAQLLSMNVGARPYWRERLVNQLINKQNVA